MKARRFIRIPAALGVLALGVTTVASAGQIQPADRPQAAPGTAAATGAAVPSDYVIGSDDVLGVLFWRDKDLTADVVVRPDGKISLPLLADIQAAGLTPNQLRDRIAESASRFIEDPSVTVIVRQINSRKAFITGQVNRPGAYSITSPTTVLQLISLAGGLGEFANRRRVVVIRSEGGKHETFRFNYDEVVGLVRLEQNIVLKPGDSVVVP